MNFLLDKHTLLWMGEGKSRVPKRIKESSVGSLFISALSLYEIYFKVACGQFRIPDKIENFITQDIFPILTISKEDAITAAKLPLIHRDPIDRLLIAQAKNRGLTLVTADHYIPQYPVKVLEI